MEQLEGKRLEVIESHRGSAVTDGEKAKWAELRDISLKASLEFTRFKVKNYAVLDSPKYADPQIIFENERLESVAKAATLDVRAYELGLRKPVETKAGVKTEPAPEVKEETTPEPTPEVVAELDEAVAEMVETEKAKEEVEVKEEAPVVEEEVKPKPKRRSRKKKTEE